MFHYLTTACLRRSLIVLQYTDFTWTKYDEQEIYTEAGGPSIIRTPTADPSVVKKANLIVLMRGASETPGMLSEREQISASPLPKIQVILPGAVACVNLLNCIKTIHFSPDDDRPLTELAELVAYECVNAIG